MTNPNDPRQEDCTLAGGIIQTARLINALRTIWRAFLAALVIAAAGGIASGFFHATQTEQTQ